MFTKNKYYRWYYQIINNARKRGVPDEYYERHHIIPTSLGGTNSEFNIVNLTYREHILVHWILIKITTGPAKKSMIWALFRMAGANYVYGQPRDPPRWLVVLAKKVTKGRRSGKDNGFYGKKVSQENKAYLRTINLGKKYGPTSVEERLKRSLSQRGRSKLGYEKAMQIRSMRNEGYTLKMLIDTFGVSEGSILNVLEGRTWKCPDGERKSRKGIYIGEKNFWYGKKHTEESRKLMSKSHLGKKQSEDTKRKMSESRKGKNNGFYGKNHTDEARLKMSGKERPTFGERNGFAKLTEEKVMQIRYQYEVEGLTQVQIAKNFEINSETVGRICRGQRWKHLFNRPIWSTPTLTELEV